MIDDANNESVTSRRSRIARRHKSRGKGDDADIRGESKLTMLIDKIDCHLHRARSRDMMSARSISHWEQPSERGVEEPSVDTRRAETGQSIGSRQNGKYTVRTLFKVTGALENILCKPVWKLWRDELALLLPQTANPAIAHFTDLILLYCELNKTVLDVGEQKAKEEHDKEEDLRDITGYERGQGNFFHRQLRSVRRLKGLDKADLSHTANLIPAVISSRPRPASRDFGSPSKDLSESIHPAQHYSNMIANAFTTSKKSVQPKSIMQEHRVHRFFKEFDDRERFRQRDSSTDVSHLKTLVTNKLGSTANTKYSSNVQWGMSARKIGDQAYRDKKRIATRPMFLGQGIHGRAPSINFSQNLSNLANHLESRVREASRFKDDDRDQEKSAMIDRSLFDDRQLPSINPETNVRLWMTREKDKPASRIRENSHTTDFDGKPIINLDVPLSNFDDSKFKKELRRFQDTSAKKNSKDILADRIDRIRAKNSIYDEKDGIVQSRLSHRLDKALGLLTQTPIKTTFQ